MYGRIEWYGRECGGNTNLGGGGGGGGGRALLKI